MIGLLLTDRHVVTTKIMDITIMDTISVEGITPFLSNPNLFDIHVFDTLESTNLIAKDMAKTGNVGAAVAKHGTVILADTQTAGRGQYGKTFCSPPGHGIYMSVILRPEEECNKCPITSKPDSRMLITLLAAVSVSEANEAQTDKKPKTKWINDVYLNNKKICGILVESSIMSTSGNLINGNVDWTVIGIGINYDTPQSAFPEELRSVAGALFSEDPPVTRNYLISEVLNRLLTPTELYDKETLVREYLCRLSNPDEKEHVLDEIKKYSCT